MWGSRPPYFVIIQLKRRAHFTHHFLASETYVTASSMIFSYCRRFMTQGTRAGSGASLRQPLFLPPPPRRGARPLIRRTGQLAASSKHSPRGRGAYIQPAITMAGFIWDFPRTPSASRLHFSRRAARMKARLIQAAIFRGCLCLLCRPQLSPSVAHESRWYLKRRRAMRDILTGSNAAMPHEVEKTAIGRLSHELIENAGRQLASLFRVALLARSAAISAILMRAASLR